MIHALHSVPAVKRIAASLLAALLVACAAPIAPPRADVDAEADAAPMPPLHAGTLATDCRDQALLAAGDYRIENNTWGKGGLQGWSQCVGIGAARGSGVNARWKWLWPAAGDDVKAYPEVIFGRKPTHAPTTAQLPRRVDAIVQLQARYEIASRHSGSGNLAFDLWFTHSAAPAASFAAPPITHELMIWLETYGRAKPGGRLIGNVTVDGERYALYAADGFGAGWRYIAFQAERPRLGAATLDLKAFVDEARAKGLLGSNEYLASIELGNELISGSGETLLDGYAITLR